MQEKILYKSDDVKRLIDENAALLIDIRDEETYQQGHIQGAVNIPEVCTYLSMSTLSGLKELHQKFKTLFSQAGLSREKIAIFYEDCLHTQYGGSCRGYWLSKYLGQPQSGILYAGLNAWQEAGYPLVSGDYTPEPAEFVLAPRPDLMATKVDVLTAITDPSVVLLDNRDKVEWAGKSSSPYGEDFCPRKGRIPGAKWIEWYEFMDLSYEIPPFKSPVEIRAICAEKRIHPKDDIIIYCFKGSRAANTFVALQLAGFEKVRVYFASWNEWSRDFDLPIETGTPK
jgi:thiosulfate/3-mercaptopyruvate sulfurtransferase